MPHRTRGVLIGLLACGLLTALAAWSDKPAPPPDDGAGMLLILRNDGPRYWKGNLHTHSFWSDGDDFPEMIADWYKRNGYHFLGLSDHNILSEGEKWIEATHATQPREKAVEKYVARFGDKWVERRVLKDKPQVRLKPLSEFRSLLEEPGRFLMIPAEEVTHRFAKNPVHMNAINLRDVIKPIDGKDVSETMRVNLRLIADQQKRTNGRIITFINHPNFGWGVRAEDMIPVDELRYFEVYNGHSGVRNYGDATHASTERIWDIVLALRLGKHELPAVWTVATDDSHAYHVWGLGKTNPGRGWIMVRAPHLTAEALLKGIDAGDYYCSTGVVLSDVRRTKDELSLTIQPEKGVSYTTQFIATMRGASFESKPHLDAEGKPLDVTRIYSDEIGKVVLESKELNPTYSFTGKELYVRAKITSTKPHPNPYAKGDVEVAWTQPVTP
jgi:hypothetical protein